MQNSSDVIYPVYTRSTISSAPITPVTQTYGYAINSYGDMLSATGTIVKAPRTQDPYKNKK